MKNKPAEPIVVETIKRTRKRIEIGWSQGEAEFDLAERDLPLPSFGAALDGEEDDGDENGGSSDAAAAAELPLDGDAKKKKRARKSAIARDGDGAPVEAAAK